MKSIFCNKRGQVRALPRNFRKHCAQTRWARCSVAWLLAIFAPLRENYIPCSSLCVEPGHGIFPLALRETACELGAAVRARVRECWNGSPSPTLPLASEGKGEYSLPTVNDDLARPDRRCAHQVFPEKPLGQRPNTFKIHRPNLAHRLLDRDVPTVDELVSRVAHHA